jgi:hypothetical protein
MTDTETVAAPKAVRRPPPRRKVTPPAASDVVDVAELAQQNRMLLERLERLERGGTKFIESEPQPKPTMREADPESLDPFTRKILARTHAMPVGGILPREPTYNVGYRTYCRPDGMYVELQGDARNRAMYEDLGFTLLSPEEEAEYRKDHRPGIVREQQTKAALINGLRQLVKREATLSGYIDDMKWDESLGDMSPERLAEEWKALCRQTANPDRRLPTAERHRAEQQDPLLAGVETGRSVADLQRKLTAPAAQTRTIEVTQANAHMFS